MAENQLPLPNVYVYSQSISYLPDLPKFSDFFDLCLHWMSIVRGLRLFSVSGQGWEINVSSMGFAADNKTRVVGGEIVIS